MKRLLVPQQLAAAFVMTLSSLASAASINLIVSNVDLVFDGPTGELTDSEAANFSGGDTDNAQLVTSAELEVDGVSEALLISPAPSVYVDLRIPDLSDVLILNVGLVEEQGTPEQEFSFELFTDEGHSLRLAIGLIDYLAAETPVPGANLFAFFATAEVLTQNLPGGFEFPDEVLISYSSTNADFTITESGFAGALTTSGALTISGVTGAIPEPNSLALIGLAGVSLVGPRRRVR